MSKLYVNNEKGVWAVGETPIFGKNFSRPEYILEKIVRNEGPSHSSYTEYFAPNDTNPKGKAWSIIGARQNWVDDSAADPADTIINLYDSFGNPVTPYKVVVETRPDIDSRKYNNQLNKMHIYMNESSTTPDYTISNFYDVNNAAEIYSSASIHEGGEWAPVVSTPIGGDGDGAGDSAGTGTGTGDDKPVVVNPPVDLSEIHAGMEIAILSDTTGSMGGAIASVKAQAIEIVNTAFTRDSTTRIGVFGYNDPDVQTFSDLSNDQAEVIDAINKLYASAGGDTPEMTYHGIYNAAQATWSKDSVKRIFIFGDAPPKDTDFKDEALAALHVYDTGNIEQDYIQIYAIQTGNDPSATAAFEELATLTGGKYINLSTSSYDSVADAIFDYTNDGTSKDDTIVGNDKDNIIDGKGGDDTLIGGAGSDTYIEGPGSGHDTIIETNPDGKDTNKVDFTGTSSSDYTFGRDGADLTVTGADTSVTVTDFYDDTDGHKVDDLVFDDTVIDHAMAAFYGDYQPGKNITYTEAGEHVRKGILNGKQFIVAEDDAVVKTSATQDAVVVNGDNVQVNTGANNDKIYINGSGKIEGGLGSDEYFIGKEFGEVKIYDQTGGSDQMHFTNHNVSDLFISWQGKDLILQSLDNADSKVIIEQQGKILHRIESIEFKDGSELTFKELESAAKIYQNYNYADVAADSSIMDSIMQQMHQQNLI